jgi:hypothetical protein
VQCVKLRLYGKNGIRGTKDKQKDGTEIGGGELFGFLGIIRLMSNYDDLTMQSAW